MLEEYSKTRTRVTISYKNDFMLLRSDCNGASAATIIVGVKSDEVLK